MGKEENKFDFREGLDKDKIIYKNEDQYIGELSFNKKEGYGVYRYKNHDVYEGKIL